MWDEFKLEPDIPYTEVDFCMVSFLMKIILHLLVFYCVYEIGLLKLLQFML